MRIVVAACVIGLIGAAILAWPTHPAPSAPPVAKPRPVVPAQLQALAKLPASALAPTQSDFERIALDQLRYIRYVPREQAAWLDDPVERESKVVRAGDLILGMTVVSVDDKSVRLAHPRFGGRVIAFSGRPPAPETQRPFPDRPEELAVAYAPGVSPDSERERQRLLDSQPHGRHPGRAREGKHGKN